MKLAIHRPAEAPLTLDPRSLTMTHEEATYTRDAHRKTLIARGAMRVDDLRPCTRANPDDFPLRVASQRDQHCRCPCTSSAAHHDQPAPSTAPEQNVTGRVNCA